MKALIKTVNLLMLTLTVYAPLSSAVGVDTPKTERVQKAKVSAVLRIENDKAVCVHYAQNAEVNHELAQFPLCPTEGPIAEEMNAALRLGENRGEVRTAFLSHIGAFALGCIGGSVASWVGPLAAVAVRYPNIDGQSASGLGSAVIGLTGLAMLSASDPTAHLASAAVGYVACAAGMAFLYFE